MLLLQVISVSDCQKCLQLNSTGWGLKTKCEQKQASAELKYKKSLATQNRQKVNHEKWSENTLYPEHIGEQVKIQMFGKSPLQNLD